jgi:osomolarity two-component system sensor histidine kinase NIK1
MQSMAIDLSKQRRSISDTVKAILAGNFSPKVDVVAKGEMLLVKESLDAMVNQLPLYCPEISRMALEVGTQGKLSGRAGLQGKW